MEYFIGSIAALLIFAFGMFAQECKKRLDTIEKLVNMPKEECNCKPKRPRKPKIIAKSDEDLYKEEIDNQ